MRKIFLLTFFILLLSTCAVNDLRKIIEDPEVHPEWDVNAGFLVFDKTISFEDAFSNIKIDPYNGGGGIPIGTEWPNLVPPGTNPIIIPGTTPGLIPIDKNVDIGATGTPNLVVQGIYSTNASLTLTIWIDNGTDILTIDPAQITISSVVIEAEAYNFSYSHTDSNNKLIFVSTNFLDPTNNYYLPLNANDEIDIGPTNITVNPVGTTTYTGTALTFNCYFQFSLGNFNAVGIIDTADVSGLINIFTQYIAIGDPISSMSIKNLDNVKIECTYESALPTSVLTTLNLSAGPNPSPASPDPITFFHGNYSDDSLNLYSYVSSIYKSSVISAIGAIPALDQLMMNVKVDLIETAPLAVRISPKDNINLKVKFSGKATVGF